MVTLILCIHFSSNISFEKKILRRNSLNLRSDMIMLAYSRDVQIYSIWEIKPGFKIMTGPDCLHWSLRCSSYLTFDIQHQLSNCGNSSEGNINVWTRRFMDAILTCFFLITRSECYRHSEFSNVHQDYRDFFCLKRGQLYMS